MAGKFLANQDLRNCFSPGLLLYLFPPPFQKWQEGTNRNTNQTSIFLWEHMNQLVPRNCVDFNHKKKLFSFKHGAGAFQYIPLGIFGGPEKDREFCFELVDGLLCLFFPESSGQLNVLGSNCHSLSMYCAEVGVLKKGLPGMPLKLPAVP